MVHTPGPWAYDPDTHHIVSTVEYEDWSVDLDDWSVDPDDPDLLTPRRIVCLYGAMGDNNVENTRLMVAAPTLLDLLQKAREQLHLVQIMRDADKEYDNTMQLIAEVDAAIALTEQPVRTI